MKRVSIFLSAAACFALPAFSQANSSSSFVECACNNSGSAGYNDELAGGYYDRANHLTGFRADLPIMKIIKVTPDENVPKFDGVIIHRGGEVTYTSPDRRIYAASPIEYKGSNGQYAVRPTRVRTVGNTRIVYAPEAFRPAMNRARKD